MKSISRSKSFIIIAVIYVLAAILGIIIYRILPFDFWLNLLLADIAATVFTFIFSLIFQNASVYDPYWSVQPIVILVYAAITHSMTPHRLLLLIAVCVWGIRLTANWAYTFHGLGHQDWRYTMLKDTSGALYPFINFAGIHLFPTLVVYGCILPAVFAFEYETHINLWNVVFFVLSISAALLQLVADTQMHHYRSERKTPFIRTGLWKYARHPNYLGEILMWWGVGLSVFITIPGSIYLLFGSAVNTLMFLLVSIPMADKRQSKKPGFEEYKNSTHMLIPLKLGLEEDESVYSN